MASPSRPISIIILGGDGVGKSAFILRFTNDIFGPENAPPTHCQGDIEVDGQEWHVTSHESTLSLMKRSLLASSRGLLILYAVNDRSSFERAQQWLEKTATKQRYSHPILLVATKTDLPSEQVEVQKEEAQALAESLHAKFIETSAASSSESVRNAYASIIRSIELLGNETPSLSSESSEKSEKCVIS